MSIVNSPRCGAKARSKGGAPCLHVALANGRCHYHGGKSTGARTLEGKQRQRNASLKHGYYSKEMSKQRSNFGKVLKSCREELNNLI